MLRKMEEFQRYLERDPAIGYSFSLADIIRAVNMVFHELEPKWGVIPNSWVDVGGLFFIYFSGSPPTETAKYVTPDYTTAHVTVLRKDHKGENIRRIIERCKAVHRRESDGEGPLQARGRADRRARGGERGDSTQRPADELPRLLHHLHPDLLFTYRSWMAGIYMLIPLFLSNLAINAYMGAANIGINVVDAAGGDGRARLRHRLRPLHRQPHHRGDPRSRGDLDDAVARALSTSGKAVTFTAVTMIVRHALLDGSRTSASTPRWAAAGDLDGDQLRRHDDAHAGADLVFKPKFIMKEAGKGTARPLTGIERSTAAAS